MCKTKLSQYISGLPAGFLYHVIFLLTQRASKLDRMILYFRKRKNQIILPWHTPDSKPAHARAVFGLIGPSSPTHAGGFPAQQVLIRPVARRSPYCVSVQKAHAMFLFTLRANSQDRMIHCLSIH